MLTAVLRLVLVLLRVSGFKLEVSEFSDSRRPGTTRGSGPITSARSTIDPAVRAPSRSG
jgi:hypothetical protein